MTTLLWVVIPYICLSVLVGGTIWRYRYDRFGWTTRSSQLYESRLLRLGSPMFHFGILVVAIGHIGGLLIPESWTSGAGLSEDAYHAVAVGLGTVAGICTLGGLAILIYRRRTVGPVFSATTKMDKLMYVVLTFVILAGLGTTVIGNLVGDPQDYRLTVSVWFRSIFYLQPNTSLMADASVGYQIHATAAFLLFALWPFTRLIHVFSAPIGYLTRPYIVYRRREPRFGTRPARRGWERAG